MLGNITTLYPNSKQYPPLLSSLQSPPMLSVLGNIDALYKPTIAIIGSRKMSTYGSMVTKRLCKTLAGLNCATVAGLAVGIDLEAHITSATLQIPTIAVLGYGLGYLPKMHQYKHIKSILASGGCVVSTYTFASKPEKYKFVERNQVIAGLSCALVVVEAAIHSGTNHTVNFMLSLGRSVYAVPGSIFSATSRGTNSMIYDGATPLKDISELRINFENHTL
ncbi:DNA-protecting protein DprA [candidate division WWE3 bacterium]|uniref:DNA-protecting protein DprA n=1 Tax=candidate division WWE3 bacterium TaxID=2053526 RepID=A0A955EBJ9_UNCKA|nr:DNA-protecting protein DprA [candidate division WWE3 bacterium]